MKGKFDNLNAFGVELEILIPNNLSQQDVVAAIVEAEVDCRMEGYNHRTTSYWKMTTDCTVKALSLSRYFYGNNELVSPKLSGQEGKEELKTVLRVLNDLGCRVNKTCGTHVHHDVTDTMLKSKEVVTTFLNNLIKTVLKYEHLIYRLIAPSRLKKIGQGWWTLPARYVFGQLGDWDRELSVEKIVKTVKKSLKRDCDRKYERCGEGVGTSVTPYQTQQSRYCGLNLKNIWTRGSVEFRYHHGTLNFDKLWAWIVFTQAILNVSKINKGVNFTNVQRNEHGMFHLRKAVGFIGSKDRCDEVKFANKVITKRFKEMSTSQMESSRRSTKYYYTIKEQLKRSI